MRYKRAKDIFPDEILELLQGYVDGEYIYFPRKAGNRKIWGESTGSREETSKRNREIYQQYKSGKSIETLATDYFLSEKSIQRIITQEKKKAENKTVLI